MRAAITSGAGGPDVLSVTDLPDPEPGPGELAITVAATAVNRADLLQRQGHYPPPPGASEIIGLECSGTVAALGEGVTDWAVGDEVCALLAGGGYAERVVVPAGQVMPVPVGIDLVSAAAIPEVACTVWSNVFMVAVLQPGEHFLVHGGAGGIGTFAIQLGSRLGAHVYTTGGTPEKLAACAELGAEVTINYRDDDFVEVVRDRSDGHGADVILDNMGASYLGRNVDALALEGRLVVIGMQGGSKATLDIAALHSRRGSITATSLRSRPVHQKAAICRGLVEHVWPLFGTGSIQPPRITSYPLAEAAAAHAQLESGQNLGKIILIVNPAP